MICNGGRTCCMDLLQFMVLLFIVQPVTHAAPDNRGVEFVIGYMQNRNLTQPVHLFVTTSRTTVVNVRVTAPRFSLANVDGQFTVTSGEVYQLKIDNRIRGVGTELSSKGVLVTADDEVVVYGTNIEEYSNDAFLGYPVDVLGTEYYAVTHYPCEPSPCELMVIGVEDGTSVTVTLGVHSSIEVMYNNRKYYKNEVINVNMDRLDTLQIQTCGDLTGTHIDATKKVAVMSGNVLTIVPPGKSKDHTVEMMLPVDVWGKKFAIVSTPERTVGDNVRFLGSKDSTSVTVTCSGGWSQSFSVNAGRHVLQVTPSDQCCYVEATEAIMVILIVMSQVGRREPADPSIISIPPIEQYAADYTFATPKYSFGEYKNFFMFIVKESEKGGLKADGNTFPSGTTYTRIPNTDFVGGHVVLAPGTHTLRHDSPVSVFGGFMYGRAKYESYGMPTGLRMAPINTVCVPSTTQVGDGIDNDCDGLIDEEMCTVENNGADDDGDGRTEEDCATPSPINGGYADWVAWAICSCNSRLTGGGTKTRTRGCTNPEPKYDGLQCVGVSAETVSCTPTIECPIDGNWGSWGAWASCSVSCASGSKTRNRSCDNPAPLHNGADCSGSESDMVSCDTGVLCPVDGAYTTWGSWSGCSVTCGGGSSTRTRSCTNPPRSNGGVECVGSATESFTCNTNNCPVDGGFTSWSEWTSCTVTCAGGINARARTCTNPAPQYGGADCNGASDQTKTCNTLNCPIDGGYSVWTAWSPCGVTCGNTTHSRSRTCDNPPPQYNGAQCAGDASETQDCYAGIMCPIDGGLTTWSVWTTCTVTCAGGTQNRSRSCTNPEPRYNGALCTGDTAESQACNTINCQINDGWTDWTDWADCSSTCGPGVITRDRTCIHPPAQYNGTGCIGNVQDSLPCNGSCIVNGNWGSWGAWTRCTKSCNIGWNGRVRLCDNPTPTPDGDPCFGESFELGYCNAFPCNNDTNHENNYVSRCPPGYFTCQSASLACVSIVLKCDCNPDCDDGSDETTAWAACSTFCTSSASVIGGSLVLMIAGLQSFLCLWTSM